MSISKITLGGGCFWCVEAVFQRIEGVKEVISGYAGGATENPNYAQVCSGQTGHAEVIQIEFDSEVISLEALLNIFWRAHDPTTLNRQGADRGTQYRSIILYQDEQQKQTAEASIKALNASALYPQAAVTELAPLKHFYAAEHEHQNYYNDHSYQPYCQVVIAPKLAKLKLN